MNTPAPSTSDLAGRDAGPAPDAPTSPYPDEPRDRRPDDPGPATEQMPADPAAQEPAAREVDAPLLDDETAEPFMTRWSEVQARFVDDPRQAVQDADGLVAELMQSLAQRFSQHKGGLEEQWNRGDEPDTESLRLALQQYRSFFDRLLST
jgi:hypothetical protein